MIRAYLWQAIIRLGFCPASTQDQKRWLRQYGQSLKEFWEIPSYPEVPSMEKGRIKSNINCTGLFNLSLEYAVETADKFIVRFLYLHPADRQELIMWVHDVDEGKGKYFCFPAQSFLSAHKLEKAAMRSFTAEDIEAVAEGLLFHPKAHQHIESPALLNDAGDSMSLSNYDIRIGGGIDNPFLYLFHLRYQLCLIPARREMEKERLLVLFEDALRNNNPITANKLFR